MIALISGRVAVRRADHVVVDCSGVGYRLAISAQTLRQVPAIDEDVVLHTHLVVRDDALALYGFATEEERELFLMLLGVRSVGPKVALAVLSGGPPRELLKAIALGDAARFQAVPGIGKRTAERIIVELREKVARNFPSRRSRSPAATTRSRWRARACSDSATAPRKPMSCSTVPRASALRI